MRRLTDTQSRQVCRWAFLMLCPLPTLLVIALACNVWTTEDWELVVAAELKLDVDIERVENPVPGRTVLHAVAIRRGTEYLGSVDTIEYHWLGDWLFQVGTVKLAAGGLEQLRLSLEEVTARQTAGGRHKAWHLRCPQVVLAPPPQPADKEDTAGPLPPLKLEHLELLSSPAGDVTRQLLRLQLPGSTVANEYPIEMRILQGASVAERQVELKVSRPAPVWLLAGLGCFPPGWDDELLFSGTLDYRQLGRAPPTGKLESAVLSNIDLAWLGKTWGIPLSGRAEIQIPALSWREGRVHRAEFQVHAADGEFHPSWVDALGRIPGLRAFQLADQPVAADRSAFRLFAARFVLQAGTCRISPITHSTAAICWDATDQPLLAIDPPGYAQTDLELLARVSLEPENPELLADDQLVELLGYFHLPPDTRSARQLAPGELR